MKRNFLILFSGLLFSVGLFVSGMTNPQKVISFLDIFGNWDPSLAFVMVGAILPTFVLYRLIWKRQKPWFENDFHLPATQVLDRYLILGSLVFGIGWGISGICPGPGVANVLAGRFDFVWFVIFMFLGFILGGRIKR